MINRTYINQVFLGAAAIVIGLLLTYVFVSKNSSPYLLLIAGCAAIGFLVLVRQVVSLEQLFWLTLYLLIAATFLNNAIYSIDVGPFSLFPYRLLLVAALVLFIVNAWQNKGLHQSWDDVRVKGMLSFFLFWLGYGFISLLWTKSLTDGLKYLFLLGMGTAFICLIVMHFTKLERLVTFYSIWMVMTVLLMLIGFYNHFTMQHLPSSSLYSGPEYKQHYPTSVFFNQNDFATFLSITFFFYLSVCKNVKNGYVKGSAFILSLCSVVLIGYTGSRASLLGIALGLAVYVFIMLPRLLKKWAVILSAACSILFVTLFYNKIAGVIYRLFIAPSNSAYSNEMLPSNEARANLLKNSFHYFLDSFGFGVGVGNVPYYLQNEPIFATNQVEQVHNWLVEILVNFGLVIFLGYVLLYAFLFIQLYQFYGKGLGRNEKMLIEGTLVALVSFLVSSISPSSVSNLFFHWVFLALAISIVNVMKKRKAEGLTIRGSSFY
ncbi:O-antigen ligase family protein [Bacillus gobiensis]|uniref:teichuronic acid biosynthesis protein TuaE n=1 Tax=Bacillus gobiensis TaxID=1441095 RepID=UPI003D247C00